MTTSTLYLNRPATAGQIGFLKRLAVERGVTFCMPRSFDEADRSIKGLLRLEKSTKADRDADREACRSGLAQCGGSAAVRDDELTGYGATAAWASGSDGALPDEGSRWELRHEIERFPHFTAPRGATGTVVQSDSQLIALRLDQPIAGAKAWDNEVVWSRSDESPGGPAQTFREDCRPL